MLTIILGTLALAAENKGLLGVLGLAATATYGLVKWLDSRICGLDDRVRDVETDTASNTATIKSIDNRTARMEQKLDRAPWE